MILHVFDEGFVYRGRVEHWIDMTWTEEYQGEGKFNLITYDTDKYAELLRKGCYFYRSDRPCAMMAVDVKRNTEKNTITVGGYTALHILTRRVITLPQKITNIETGAYNLIFGYDFRGLNTIAQAESKGLEATIEEMEIEGEGMLDAVLTVIKESDYGIRANFDYKNKRHVIEVYEGIDRCYNSTSGGTVFSQEFGNLRNLVVTEDDDIFKNVAYVTGAANNDPRTVYYQYVSDGAGPYENWREVLVDGESQGADEPNEDWRKRQRSIGIKALQDYNSALSFEVELSPGIFGTKYDLGDKVTCKSRRYGLQFDTRITEYKYSNREGVENVTITLGDKPLGYVKGEIIRNG